MSQTGRVLEVLRDGRPHSVREIHERAGYSRLNSRVAELRKKGYVIECDTVEAESNVERYVYRLVASPETARPRTGRDERIAEGNAAAPEQAGQLTLEMVA